MGTELTLKRYQRQCLTSGNLVLNERKDIRLHLGQVSACVKVSAQIYIQLCGRPVSVSTVAAVMCRQQEFRSSKAQLLQLQSAAQYLFDEHIVRLPLQPRMRNKNSECILSSEN